MDTKKASKEDIRMNNRERTMNILHYKEVDRFPAVHFGYWRELLLEWAEQGKISREIAEKQNDGNAYDRQLDEIIGWDFGWTTRSLCTNGLNPQFEPEVLETFPDGTQRVQTRLGVIERIKPGVVSIPSEDDYLLKDRDAFLELYLPKMQFCADRVKEEVIKKFNEARSYEIPFGLHVGSVLGQIRDMTTVVGMSYLMYDEDETLFADIIDAYADMQYKCVEAVLECGVKADFAHFWEDVCFKNGPLIAPELFDELCGKHYKKRTELLKKHGIDIVSLDCDGVTEKLLPTWFDNGVNTMFPIEVGVWGDQFANARMKFGDGMRGVGGMDKIAFLKDKDAVDAEIARMERLASLGGFIPCPDHRLMPGSKFELVQYYAENIKKIRV